MPPFDWDRDKAEANLQKHGISFETATTVFADPLALTFFDAAHFADEGRYLTIPMQTDNDDMLPEYDFVSMGSPERGKQYAKYQRYVRTIRLPDDLADRFPDEKSVLDALRRDTYRHSITKTE